MKYEYVEEVDLCWLSACSIIIWPSNKPLQDNSNEIEGFELEGFLKDLYDKKHKVRFVDFSISFIEGEINKLSLFVFIVVH